ILLESFDDPTAFASNWTIFGAAASVRVGSGYVSIAPPAGATVGVAADGVDGLFHGPLLGRAPGTTGTVQAATNVDPQLHGYGCGVASDPMQPEIILSIDPASGPGQIVHSPLSSVAISSGLLVRMTAVPALVDCRVDYGIATDFTAAPSSGP